LIHPLVSNETSSTVPDPVGEILPLVSNRFHLPALPEILEAANTHLGTALTH